MELILVLVLGGHRPLSFFTAIFEGALKVKILIDCFSPKVVMFEINLKVLMNGLHLWQCK